MINIEKSSCRGQERESPIAAQLLPLGGSKMLVVGLIGEGRQRERARALLAMSGEERVHFEIVDVCVRGALPSTFLVGLDTNMLRVAIAAALGLQKYSNIQ